MVRARWMIRHWWEDHLDKRMVVKLFARMNTAQGSNIRRYPSLHVEITLTIYSLKD